MYLTGSTVTVSGASFTSCTASVRRTHNSRRHSRTAIACRQPTPNIPRHTTQHHATPHLTSTAITTLHTSIPPEGQGTPPTSLPAMPYPSTHSLTHPHPESSSSSTPPPIPHCHRPRTPLFQSSDDTTPHPMRPITTLHTSIPPEGQGTPLTSLPVMPYPSTRSLTHPHPESSSSSPPPVPHRHRPALTSLNQAMIPHHTTPDEAHHRPRHPRTPHPPPSTLHTPHSTSTFTLVLALSRSLSLTLLTPPPPLTLHTHPPSNGTRCWVGRCTARCWRGVSLRLPCILTLAIAM